MDFNTRCKISGYSYTAPVVTTPMPTLLEMKREAADNHYSYRPRVKAHDCRDEKLVHFRDKHLWESWLLSHGIRQTSESVNTLFKPGAEELKNQADKLAFTIGERGSVNGHFEYPRGLTIDDEGNIYVADSGNHRVQIFNQCGVYKRKLGSKGSGPGEFNKPSGVAVLPNDDIAVADQKNKRVQVFSPSLKFKFEYPTVDEPIGIASDSEFNLVLATTNRSIEIYRRHGKLLSRFTLPGKKSKSSMFYIALNNKDEVLVSEPSSLTVAFFSYQGEPLYQFEPLAASQGLGVVPVGVAVDPLGQVVVADSLNHVINVYSERGVLQKHFAGPGDQVGALLSIAVGPDGHLVAAEATANGPHCVKIFKYLDCECHRDRPGSSLRRTPVPDDVE